MTPSQVGGETPPVVPVEAVIDSSVAGLFVGSVQEMEVMEMVVANSLAEKEAEIAILKRELTAEKEAVLILRQRAESGLVDVSDAEAYVLQQQSDLQAKSRQMDAERQMLKEALRVFKETTKL